MFGKGGSVFVLNAGLLGTIDMYVSDEFDVVG